MADKKHIVIDARNRRSSTGRYTDQLLTHLQQLAGSEYRFSVLVQRDDPWQPINKDFLVVYCSFPQFSFNLFYDLRFTHLLRQLRPDLVHFTMTQQPLSYRGTIVTTTHDLTMLRFVRAGRTPKPIFWLKKRGYELLFRRAHRKSRKIIVPSQFVAEDLAEYQPSTEPKIVVIREAVGVPTEVRIEPFGQVQAPFILHVGSPFPHKNIEGLIEAFEIARRAKPELQLVLAGKKEYYFEQLQALVQKLPYRDAIIMPGFVTDGQLKWLYEHAEAYIFPSFSEGFGLPGLEAMAHNCPLLSSNATCLPEIYGDAAHYFSPRDPGDIARKIVQVVGDEKLRAELIVKGRKQVAKYSWQKTAEQTLDVYINILT